MAVDVVSPRISFSHDLKESDSIPVEYHHRRSDQLLLESIDFNFSIGHESFQEQQDQLSSADELFADGKILPVEVKKTNSCPIKQKPTRQSLESKPISSCFRRSESPNEDTKKKSLKEFLLINSDDAEEEEKKPQFSSNSKPFWQFRRSSSLNFDSYKTNSLIRSLHFLSRSNSTGSAPNPKQPSKMIQKQQQHCQKDTTSSMKRTNSSSSSNQYYYSYKSPSLRKNNSVNGHGHGIRISPVIHIPHACISRNSVFFGFTSLFCNGKSKKKKKSP
ncbi:hypothetical protein M9H77_08509 [Catharanthus roseus]|uniref:Uncharacterized protein n=1 Tax=Catharanthus roseus TaxID=4058 RepID=A0ACC0BY58_CATRO|nr:hypothetical protein M9H77_08509 [Catharanthus roseus]